VIATGRKETRQDAGIPSSDIERLLASKEKGIEALRACYQRELQARSWISTTRCAEKQLSPAALVVGGLPEARNSQRSAQERGS